MRGPDSESHSKRATLRDYLKEAPFSLAMSSGFFSFFAHTGFLTVLEDEGLLPTRASGSSAGALVMGTWAAGLDAPVLARELEQLERRDFWDPGMGAGLLRGRLFRDRLERLLPNRAFDKSRIPVAISAFEVRTRRTRRGASRPRGCREGRRACRERASAAPSAPSRSPERSPRRDRGSPP